MWWKIYADGSEIDIIHADTLDEAIEAARVKHGDAVYTGKAYGT